GFRRTTRVRRSKDMAPTDRAPRARPAALACGLVLLAAPAWAQPEPGHARFCLQPPGGQKPAAEACTYATLADCEAATKGAGERCVPNPALTFPGQPDDPKVAPEGRR